MAILPNPDSFRPADLWEIKNYLGFLSDDFHYFHPHVLREIYPNVSDLAQSLGIQRTQLYLDRAPIRKNSKLRKHLFQLATVSDIAYLLLGRDREKTLKWLSTPNIRLFGDAPFAAILNGEGECLITWLLQRAGFKPGQAF